MKSHSKTRLLFSTAWTYLKVLRRAIWNGNLFAVLDGIDRIREQSNFFGSLATELYQAAMEAKARGDYEEWERLYESHSQICRRYKAEVVDAFKQLTGEDL